MGLNLNSVRFKNFTDISIFNDMSTWQLENYLKLELKDINKLKEAISAANANYSQAIKDVNVANESMNRQALIARIIEARGQKVALAAQLQSLTSASAKLNNLPKEKQVDFATGKPITSSKDKHEAYKRVMEGLTSRQEDLRETWDSNDVISIDDYVIQTGVTYDAALEYIENQSPMDRATDLPEDV